MSDARRSTDPLTRHRQIARLLSEQVFEARRRAGLSQEQVAQKAGISVDTYSVLERGFNATGELSNPTLKTLTKVLSQLDVEGDLHATNTE